MCCAVARGFEKKGLVARPQNGGTQAAMRHFHLASRYGSTKEMNSLARRWLRVPLASRAELLRSLLTTTLRSNRPGCVNCPIETSHR